MDFIFTEEQIMLAESVARFIDNEYDFESRQKYAESKTGFSAEIWSAFAELGWTAIPFNDEDGGFDGGPVELALLMEQFGRGLVVEPYLSNIVLAGGVLKRIASTEQKARWLTPIIEGKLHAALAFAEPQARFDFSDIRTIATKKDDGFVLNGQKNFVLNAGTADLLIVPAVTDGDGVRVFAIPSSAAGIVIRAYPTIDGRRAGEIELTDVQVDSESVLDTRGNGLEALESAICDATLAVSAEAVGIMQSMHDKTLDHLKNRTQFGVPIGSFQALQHRMVDSMIACEQTRSLMYCCINRLAESSTVGDAAVSALKYQVGTAGVRVAREAVQLHGGMGVTYELDVAHHFRRMTAIDVMFGNADYQLDRVVNMRAANP